MKGRIFKIFAVVLLGFVHQFAAAASVTYVYTDPFGTPLAEADGNGNITATFDYKPYGHQALGAQVNGPGYAGHVTDADTGLVYMQARYYDPDTGRFVSLDPESPNSANLFNFNRFSYANDNPVVNIDLDGRETGAGYGNGEYYAHYPTKRDIEWQNAYVKFIDERVDDVNQLVASNPEIGPSFEAAGEAIDYIAAALGSLKATEVVAPVVAATEAASDVPRPVITAPYARPSGTPTVAQRASVQGKPCADCGATASVQVADHKVPLVQEYYETGTINMERAKSVDAVQPQCPTCSARQGAALSRYSRAKKLEHGLDGN